jgi:hypothetical protein
VSTPEPDANYVHVYPVEDDAHDTAHGPAWWCGVGLEHQPNGVIVIHRDRLSRALGLPAKHAGEPMVA